MQDWTTDRRAISRAVARVSPAGGTAMYDAVADAVPLANAGKHPKKALLVISDGNDTNSSISVGELRQLIRESEVLVYALGVDGTATTFRNGPTIQIPMPIPFPIPGPSPAGRLPADHRRRRHQRSARRGGAGESPTRCARSPTTPAAARKSSAASAISTTPPRGSPTN